MTEWIYVGMLAIAFVIEIMLAVWALVEGEFREFVTWAMISIIIGVMLVGII